VSEQELGMSNGGLSGTDIRALMTNPSDNVRAGIAKKIAEEVTAKQLSEQEREIAHGILLMMTKDVAEQVRKQLSESLKASECVPHDVAMALAQDIESISLPILEFSPVFTDWDLIEIIKSGAASKQTVIAKRESVSTEVAGALVETDNSAAVVALAGNTGAQMSDETLDKMIERHGDDDQVGQSLAMRGDLSLEIAERLTAHVSGEWKDILRQNYGFTEHQALDLAEVTREKATIDLVEKAASTSDVDKLAAKLYENGRLTASLMLRSMCTGDIRFFEAAMAKMAGITRGRACLMIHDVGKLGLEAIFKRCQLPDVYFPAFRVAVDVYQDNEYTGDDNDRERFKQRMIERILTQYQSIEGEDIDYLINSLGKAGLQPRAA
jgi:uncharacterized protein (DUF2336 family)